MSRGLTSRRPGSRTAAHQHAEPDRQSEGTPAGLLPGLRAAVLSVATGSAAGGLGLAARSVLGPAPAHASVDLLVAAAVLAAGAVAATLLFVGGLLLVLTHLTRSAGRSARALESLAARCTPVAVRRVVAVGLGAGLGLLGPAGLASATEPDLGWAVTQTTTPSPATSRTAASAAGWSAPTPRPAGPEPVASPTPTPDGVPAPVVVLTVSGAGSAAPGPTAAAAASTAAAMPAPVATARVVTVRPGDSLWSIAATDLGVATAAGIASEWPRWYAENSATIGNDPDQIRPGQVLVAPARIADAS